MLCFRRYQSIKEYSNASFTKSKSWFKDKKKAQGLKKAFPAFSVPRITQLSISWTLSPSSTSNHCRCRRRVELLLSSTTNHSTKSSVPFTMALLIRMALSNHNFPSLPSKFYMIPPVIPITRHSKYLYPGL